MISIQEKLNSKADIEKTLNSYITENFSSALQKAKRFDEKPNLDLKLPGIPIAVKDLFCTNGVRTTAGSKILNNFTQTYSLYRQKMLMRLEEH